MKGIVCRGLFHDDLLLQCNDANGRALPTSLLCVSMLIVFH